MQYEKNTQNINTNESTHGEMGIDSFVFVCLYFTQLTTAVIVVEVTFIHSVFN